MGNTAGAKRPNHAEAELKPFCKACLEGNLTSIDKYLKAGEDVNQVFIVDGRDWTPLMRASFDGNQILLRVLLENGSENGAIVNLQV